MFLFYPDYLNQSLSKIIFSNCILHKFCSSQPIQGRFQLGLSWRSFVMSNIWNTLWLCSWLDVSCGNFAVTAGCVHTLTLPGSTRRQWLIRPSGCLTGAQHPTMTAPDNDRDTHRDDTSLRSHTRCISLHFCAYSRSQMHSPAHV